MRFQFRSRDFPKKIKEKEKRSPTFFPFQTWLQNSNADERFKEERNLMYISKWLKSSIKNYGSFEESLEGLQSFFQNVEVCLLQFCSHLQILYSQKSMCFFFLIHWMKIILVTGKDKERKQGSRHWSDCRNRSTRF